MPRAYSAQPEPQSVTGQNNTEPAAVHADQQQPGRPFGAGRQALTQGVDFFSVGGIEVLGHGVVQIGDQSPSVQLPWEILQIIRLFR